jgi:Tol biopolymer transport system component
VETIDRSHHHMPASRPSTSESKGSPSDRRSWLPVIAAIGAFVLLFGGLTTSYLVFSRAGKADAVASTRPHIVRLTQNGFDEDGAAWMDDDSIRFIRFTAVNRVESVVMNSDGSDQRKAGGEIRDFRAGTWSPDGKRVLYVKEGVSPRVSFIADADGTNEKELPFSVGPLDWSRDGKFIVYNANSPGDGNSEVFLYTLETGEARNISGSPAFDANPSFSPDGKQVIFNSDRDGNHEIYLMNVDGSGIRRLTNHPAKEAFHAFSPDGTQIVFNSNRDNEKVGVYLMNVNDDSPPVKLSDTKSNAEIRPGCWSPDGTRIVFTSDMDGEKYNVYTMTVEPFKTQPIATADNGEIRGLSLSPEGERLALAVKVADGSGELRIMDLATGKMKSVTATENYDLSPSWSPDGRSIALASKIGGNTEIAVVGVDRSELKNITQSASRDGGPAWSPDGQQIMFSSDREAPIEGIHLFLSRPDGSDVRRLTSRRGYEMTPAWSPDGVTIAYACDRADGTSAALDIFIADSRDPNSERLLATRRFHDSNPVFSRDGRRVAFMSQSDGNFEIYVVNTDGTGLVRVTRNPAEDAMPSFSHDGRKIYFVSNRSGRFGLYAVDIGR